MTKEEIQLSSLAQDAYEAVVDCISTISAEHIQEFGNVKMILKQGSAANALAMYLRRVHILEKLDFRALETATDAETTTNSLFPETSTGEGPRRSLYALVTLAKKYRLLIEYAKEMQASETFLQDVKDTLVQLQLAYDEAIQFKSKYTEISSLKDRNHIATIGGLISAIERKQQEAKTKVIKKGDTTLFLPKGA